MVCKDKYALNGKKNVKKTCNTSLSVYICQSCYHISSYHSISKISTS